MEEDAWRDGSPITAANRADKVGRFAAECHCGTLVIFGANREALRTWVAVLLLSAVGPFTRFSLYSL